MSTGLLILLLLMVALLAVAIFRGEDSGLMVQRFVEQFAMLVPRMLCALMAAGFIATLIPKEAIASFLGDDAGLLALLVAALAGMIIPAGPVITFAIAAVFAKSGASTAALVTFVTSWSIFAAHRIFIYEVPMLGASFLRLRLASAMILPLLAGGIVIVVGLFTAYGQVSLTP